MGKVTQIVRATVGAHEQMSIWVDHKLVGTLTLGLGDGDALEARLKSEPPVEKVLDLAEEILAVAAAAALKGGDWCAGEDFVHALELEPDKPVQCPCCTKLVTLCVKHYALHEPGKKCSGCREEA